MSTAISKLYNEAMKRQKFTVTDGKLVLTLTEFPEGGYLVTSPFYPGLITEAKTISEAFFMARDAKTALEKSRKKWAKSSKRVAVA